MIVLDIESSGLDTGRCGIWQIGAIELENPDNQFLEESRIDNEDIIDENALKINGKTKEELRDESKQSQKQMILNFIDWAKTCKTKLIVGHNVAWDFFFIANKCRRYKIQKEFYDIFGHNVIDTYTIAQMKFFELNNKFSFHGDGKGKMGLKRVLGLCGMRDERVHLDNKNEISQKGSFHNALFDAKLAGECFSRLVYGKSLFPEFSGFEIPEELRK
ncbi:MAG: 3'-5' exonuclease [Candidatus Pacearchaeota archaeon]|jgi:DNA polymerase III epsilon subunit-like protein